MLTHLEKIYWPKEKISKGDLVDYYEKVAPYLLPYLKDRPIMMHRFPNGIGEEGFYQKDVHDTPDFVKTALVTHSNRKVNYILVQNLETLLYVVNLGSIELHIFNATVKHLTKPDFLILDLDPEKVPFEAVIETALVLHEILEEKKLPHFCKTSGGRGLHILIPMGAKYTQEKVRKMAYSFAEMAQERLPKVVSLKRNPKDRQKKVYIDTLQNGPGKLIAAPYSVRAFPGAPVSTPLLWSEVKRGLDPKEFTMQSVPRRLKVKGDLLKIF